jgi:secondary thiamine-phosphate synthase enzyme
MTDEEIRIKTASKNEFVDITGTLQDLVTQKGFQNGLCTLFVPHTTAALTINENADPDVCKDILKALDHLEINHLDYQHSEGNSPAHIKSSLIGVSLFLIVKNGRLVLGTWQGIYFCEFDGPRSRKILVSLISG